MSEPRPIGQVPAQPSPPVQAAITHASQATGVDFAYLLGEARLESSLNPNARASTSSAAGLFQFTQGTWLATLERHGDKYGYGWAGTAIVGGRVRDPALRAQVMALRFDPRASALMAAELANDNRVTLTGVLGREPDAAELYLAHFLGAGGASQFLTALARDPSQSAAALFPKAAAANRAIFFDPVGQPRSLGEVMELIRAKMDRAMGGAEGLPFEPDGEWGQDWLGQGEFAFGGAAPSGYRGGDEGLSGAAAPTRPSMAETLAATFGGSAEAMPGHVRSAYGKMQVFGL